MVTAHKQQKIPLLQCNSIEDNIFEITLDNPSKRNALSLAMLRELSACFESLADNNDCRCVILSARGPVFCAGHDLKEIRHARQQPDNGQNNGQDRGQEFFNEIFKTCVELMQFIISLPSPVIAAVDGLATAAGCQLVATCDLAIASHKSLFCTPGVNIGLFCSTPMVALSRVMPVKKTIEMLLTGETITADEACHYGLINKVVNSDELRESVIAMARKIVSKPPNTIKNGKKSFYRQLEMSVADAYDFTAATMTQSALGEEALEGIAAFTEKRKPKWHS